VFFLSYSAAEVFGRWYGPEDMKNFHSAGFRIPEDSSLLRCDTVSSGATHPTTQCHIQDDLNLQQQCYEKHTSHFRVLIALMNYSVLIE